MRLNPQHKDEDVTDEEVNKRLLFQQEVDIVSRSPDQIDHVQSEEKLEMPTQRGQQASVNADRSTCGRSTPELAFEPYHTIDYFASQ